MASLTLASLDMMLRRTGPGCQEATYNNYALIMTGALCYAIFQVCLCNNNVDRLGLVGENKREHGREGDLQWCCVVLRRDCAKAIGWFYSRRCGSSGISAKFSFASYAQLRLHTNACMH